MNVAFVTPFYNGRSDGRFGRFHDWIHTLREMVDPPFDFDVVALTASNPDGTLSSEPNGYLGDGSDLWGSKVNKFEFGLNLRRARRDLLRGDYDIVHVLRLDSLLYPATMYTIGDKPVILGPNIGGWSPIRNGGRWEPDSATERLKQAANFRLRQLLASRARYDVALSFSEYHRRILAEVGIDPERVRTLHPGVDTMFHPDNESKDDETTLLYVGDLNHHKGYDVFLQALSELNAGVNVLIAGQGTPDLEIVRSLGLDDTVQHLGFVERQALPEYYNSASLLVVPSIDEMGPNTIVEALACGTPVVATDRPGINEYPPADASVFFSPRNGDTLAGALETALNKIDSMTAAAEACAPEFRADRTVTALNDLYRDVLADK